MAPRDRSKIVSLEARARSSRRDAAMQSRIRRLLVALRSTRAAAGRSGLEHPLRETGEFLRMAAGLLGLLHGGLQAMARRASGDGVAARQDERLLLQRADELDGIAASAEWHVRALLGAATDAAQADALQAIAFTVEALGATPQALKRVARGDAEDLARACHHVDARLGELERAIARLDILAAALDTEREAPLMDREAASAVQRWSTAQILRQPATALKAQAGPQRGRLVPFPTQPTSGG